TTTSRVSSLVRAMVVDRVGGSGGPPVSWRLEPFLILTGLASVISARTTRPPLTTSVQRTITQRFTAWRSRHFRGRRRVTATLTSLPRNDPSVMSALLERRCQSGETGLTPECPACSLSTHARARPPFPYHGDGMDSMPRAERSRSRTGHDR